MSRLRIRSIKPDCWADEAISPLSREARLLFVVLITFCDDDGRCRYMPSQIIGHGYLEDEDVTPADIERWIVELEASSVVVRYEVKGKHYATFPNWHKHQRINRHTPSTLPPCPRRAGVVIWPRKTHDKPDGTSLSPHDKLTEDSVSTHGDLTEDSVQDMDWGVGSRDTEEQKSPTDSAELEPTDLSSRAVVNDLFAYWQEQCGHGKAKPTPERRKAIERRLKDGYTADEIRAGIDGAAAQPFINEQGKVFDDLELICRNGSKLEDFIARATYTPQRPSSQRESSAESMLRAIHDRRSDTTIEGVAHELG